MRENESLNLSQFLVRKGGGALRKVRDALWNLSRVLRCYEGMISYSFPFVSCEGRVFILWKALPLTLHVGKESMLMVGMAKEVKKIS